VDRRTPTVSDLARLAVESCDRDSRDPALGCLEEHLEDDDGPVTAVENLRSGWRSQLRVAIMRASIPRSRWRAP
jgi:hypothetical protein